MGTIPSQGPLLSTDLHQRWSVLQFITSAVPFGGGVLCGWTCELQSPFSAGQMGSNRS